MTDAQRIVIEGIAALVVAAMIFMAGWTVRGWLAEAALAEREVAFADELLMQSLAGQARFSEAERINTALAQRVAAAENALIQITEEKDREIKRLTTGRPCLDAGVVGVLNRNAKTADNGLSAPRPAVDPAAAAFASDTDVALWIAIAQRSYDTCRGRLDAVRAFYEDAP
jgi:hypothetical protein